MLASTGAVMQGVEHQLVARCRAGDLDAFGLIYTQYERQVFRYAYHLLGNCDDADDIKQETFLRAYQALPSFRSECSLPTWLLKICGNLCRDKMKSWDKRKVIYDSRIEPDAPQSSVMNGDPRLIVERTMMTETIMRAMRGLPTAQREILVLHEIEDFSYEEIAGILGCNRTSVKLRLFRARRSLKERVTSLMQARE